MDPIRIAQELQEIPHTTLKSLCQIAVNDDLTPQKVRLWYIFVRSLLKMPLSTPEFHSLSVYLDATPEPIRGPGENPSETHSDGPSAYFGPMLSNMPLQPGHQPVFHRESQDGYRGNFQPPQPVPIPSQALDPSVLLKRRPDSLFPEPKRSRSESHATASVSRPIVHQLNAPLPGSEHGSSVPPRVMTPVEQQGTFWS